MSSFASNLKPGDIQAPTAQAGTPAPKVWLSAPGADKPEQFEAKDEILLPLMNQGYIQVAGPTEAK